MQAWEPELRSLVPRYKPVWWRSSVAPEMTDAWGSLAVSQQNQERNVQWETLPQKINWKVTKEDKWYFPWSSTCTGTDIEIDTQVYTTYRCNGVTTVCAFVVWCKRPISEQLGPVEEFFKQGCVVSRAQAGAASWPIPQLPLMITRVMWLKGKILQALVKVNQNWPPPSHILSASTCSWWGQRGYRGQRNHMTEGVWLPIPAQKEALP